MKKNYNPDDIHQQEGQEHSRKLYRSISESARRLDDARSCAQTVSDLFTPSLHIHRSKFREYCERLIFFDPILSGRKAEELLWRKGYYDVISTAKKLKKQEYTAEEIACIQTHINAGIGHYHHFISKLHHEFNLNLNNVVDFTSNNDENDKSMNKIPKTEHIEWASSSVHRCLIYLGDLSRYKLEIYPNWDPGLAIRYYLQALFYKPDYGMPHNQLGTLMSQSSYALDAAYYYIRCLSCKYVFDGAENNLHRLFEKNLHLFNEIPPENGDADCIIQPHANDHIKRLIVRFLYLTDVWFCNKNNTNIYNICHQTNMDLQECLQYSKQITSESGDTQTDLESLDLDSISSPNYLSSDLLFKIIVICLLCIFKLQKGQSQQLSTVVAFILAIYSQFMQSTVMHIHENVMNFPLPELKIKVTNCKNGLIENNKAKIKKLKIKTRRRRVKKSSSDDSDNSDVDANDERFSNSEGSADEVENESSSASSENDSEDENAALCNILPVTPAGEHQTHVENNVQETFKKTAQEAIKKSKRMDPLDMLEIIEEDRLLPSIKILNDWLTFDVEVLKSCGKNTRSLIVQMVHLINLLNLSLADEKLKEKLNIEHSALTSNLNKMALPEDILLKGTEFSTKTHENIDWGYFNYKTISAIDETVIRIQKFVLFGHFLTKIPEVGVTFNSESNMFSVKDVVENEDKNGFLQSHANNMGISELKIDSDINNGEHIKENDGKGQLLKMKHMGQLWLAAEVRALENRVKEKTNLSPYLVVDVDALIMSISMIRHLVNSRKFIVVVPSAVVSALDDLKREKPEARDAIRWLESQFHHGNRFFRAQRPQERTSIPLIKYPKKKDKEMSMYIQIIECCHYLAQQQKGAHDVVTLLVGNPKPLSNLENREMSFTGLVHSVGINLETVIDFYAKWKKPFKGKR